MRSLLASVLLLCVLIAGCRPVPVPVPVPVPPTPVPHAVALSFGPLDGADSYSVYRAPCSGALTPIPGAIASVGLCTDEGAPVKLAVTTATEYVDQAVLGGQSYSYCVSPEIGGVETECSNHIAAAVPTN